VLEIGATYFGIKKVTTSCYIFYDTNMQAAGGEVE